MCVAPSPVAMRLSEIIIIYSAVGAPFAVNYLLHQRMHVGRAHLLWQAALRGSLWPLTLMSSCFHRLSELRLRPKLAQHQIQSQRAQMIDEARRNLLAELHIVCECGIVSPSSESKKLERMRCVLRESIERYVGLAEAVKGASFDAPPGKRETELFRVAGLKGDDLLLAGQCLHRRNVRRLIEHHVQARSELLHSLAEIREAADEPRLSVIANADAARRLSIAILKLHGRAVELLSLMEDEDAAMRVTRLLDQERGRLQD